jgi:hypothetical protein
LNSPALAATPPKIRAAIPYSATLSGGWRGTGQLSQFSEGRCTLLLRSFCLLCLVPAKFMRFPRVKANGRGF